MFFIVGKMPCRLVSLLILLFISQNTFAQAGTLLLDRSEGKLLAQASSIHSNYAGNSRSPEGLLDLDDDLEHIIWVEFNNSLVHILSRDDNDGFRTEISIPMSIGKKGYGKEIEGDQRTPVGVYTIKRFIEDNDLDDFYGTGAYPIDYPNNLDKLKKRTGYGIWLHGLPKGVTSRPFRDSNGCVVIDNEHLSSIDRYIKNNKTPVVLSEELNWVSSQQRNTERDTFKRSFETWVNDWESLNNQAYLSHYSQAFTDNKRNFNQWSQYKTRVNSAKSSIKVTINHFSAVQYPGEQNRLWVRFYQDYNSNNYQWQGWKNQFWSQEDGQWKIVFEGNG